MEYNKEKREIKLGRELSKLDKFVLDFVKVLKKHVDYVIVSGYVSILFGRSRATEDIDVFIKKISLEQFSKLYKELQEKKFWCLNAEKEKDIFDYLDKGLAVRFSYEGKPMPNFEVKFPKDALDEEAFKDSIAVILKQGTIIISSLERNIAFKRYFLGSDKDDEDAIHLEELFKGQLDNGKINKIKELIKQRRKWEIKSKN